MFHFYPFNSLYWLISSDFPWNKDYAKKSKIFVKPKNKIQDINSYTLTMYETESKVLLYFGNLFISVS